MDRITNSESDPAINVTNDSAPESDVATRKEEIAVDRAENISETPEIDQRQKEDIGKEIISSSDGKEANASLSGSVPDVLIDAGEEAESEVKKQDEASSGEKEDDRELSETPEEDFEAQEVPKLGGIGMDIPDEASNPFTMRTEEEIISNVALDFARSNADERRETTKEPHTLSVPGTDGVGSKSLTPSDEVMGSKESLRSNSLNENEGIESVNVFGCLGKDSAFQRSAVIEQCRSLLIERKQLRRKNILFHKKLHDYFKKKKAEGTYHEGDSNLIGPGSAELHYRKNLLVFDDIQTQVENEKMKIEKESKELLDRKSSLQEAALLELDSLLKQEETLGHGLIYSQTGKVLSDKVSLQIINRQGQIVKQLSEARLKYIQIRDKVNATEAALKSLEVLGEGLRLIDYEELRVEKRSLHDKNEERENELSHLREKIETAVITMSHMDEKAFGIDHFIDENHKELKTLVRKLRESREKRTRAQKKLIRIRSEIEQKQHEAGLLVHQPLLRDFESVLKQVEQLEIEVNQMKKHVMHGEKVTAQPKKISSLHSLNRNESSTSASQEYSHRKINNGKLRTLSRDSINKIGPEKYKPKLVKGRPSAVRFLINQE
ncbi:cilia- and flagella-associated protein 184-like [Hetaerina americana]|uniref:cilia- and flagella-associated protein 184-like n=1 Tax=Hetaerina americana TaxID=62018 RepID=UPI003A7F135A